MKPGVRLLASSGLLLVVWTGMDAAPAPEASRVRQKAILKGIYPATDLAFSPDSKFLAAPCGIDQGVPLWDVASGKVARELPHRGALYALFSPDGKIVATAGRHLKLWETATGKDIATFKDIRPKWMLFSADNKMMAVIARREVHILSVEKREELRSYDLPPSARPVTTYPSCKTPVYAVSRGKGKPIALLDPFTGKEVVVCDNKLDVYGNLASDREEKILAGARDDNSDRSHPKWELTLWDRGKGKIIASMKPELRAGFRTFALSPDGKILVIFAQQNPPFRNTPLEITGLRFYEVPSGRFLECKETSGLNCLPHLEGSHFLVFSPDGRTIATAEGNVRLWSIPKGWRKKK